MIVSKHNYKISRKIDILCIDDETQILRALERTLRKLNCDLHFAKHPQDAIETITNTQIDIILCDMKMPDMNGAEFFSYAAKRVPHTKRILLTGYADIDSTITAINEGAINHYVRKPWQSDTLLALIQSMITDIYSERNNRYLQRAVICSRKTLRNTNKRLKASVQRKTCEITDAVNNLHCEQKATEKVLYNLLRSHPNFDAQLSRNVAKLSDEIAHKLKITTNAESSYLYRAGLLHQLGTIALDKTLSRTPRLDLNYAQQRLFTAQVDAIPSILSPMDRLSDIQSTLCFQFEGYAEGYGYPNKLSGQSIPIGARVLHIARDYCSYTCGKMKALKLTHKQTLTEMNKSIGLLYDPQILDLLLEFDGNRVVYTDTVYASHQLQPGMVLARPLFTEKHVMLLPDGHIFDCTTIGKVMAYERNTHKPLEFIVEPNDY
ncbi:HD domain-containing phosphohydrolase [Alteromonas facilis]|uniref:HD domain-containing phosphohydrolase n=1 Tax=Alteromonas facilis TaxID=2048004 RepID=UPI000C28E6A2|nr:HD domain-containing phosphohydrolase [Alteromonas facilis]